MKPVGQMQCPACEAAVPAEQINVQTMTAVCAECATVFTFHRPSLGARLQRKVHEPEAFESVIDADGTLTLRYPALNTRAERIGALAGVLLLGGLGLWLVALGALQGATILGWVGVLLLLAAVVIGFSTQMGRTSIRIDEACVVQRVAGAATLRVDLADVVRFEADQYTDQAPSWGVTPSYAVYMVAHDGTRRILTRNVPEAYADYIAYALDQQRQRVPDPDAAQASAAIPDADAHLSAADEAKRSALPR